MKLILKFLFILNFFLINNSYSENIKIVYIDMDLIIKKSIVGIDLTKQINEINRKNLVAIKKLEQELKNEDAEIGKQKNILNEDEIKSKLNALNIKVKDYQKKIQKNRVVNNNNQIKATGKLLEQLQPILSDYSKSNSISLILQKKDIIIGRNDLNVTDEIIDLLNKKIKKIDINS